MPLKEYQFLLATIASDDGSDTCLEWPYGRKARGYGQVWDGSHNRRVHVVAFATANGLDLPLDFVVRHKCDNPPCFRLRHLVGGTQKDNIQDAIARGRFKPKGMDHNLSKLTDEQVLLIRKLHAEDPKHRRKILAEMFNVSMGCIQRVVERTGWRHI